MSTIPQATSSDATTPIAPGSEELRRLLEEIAAGAAERELEERPPYDVIETLREARFGALRVPVQEGGAGASFRELFATVIDLAAADANVAHILRAHFWFVEQRLLATEPELRGRWLGEVGARRDLRQRGFRARVPGAHQAIAELRHAGARSTAIASVSTARSTTRTGSLFSDWVSVFASTEAGRLAAVIVPVDREGVTLEDDWDGMGQRLAGHGNDPFGERRRGGARADPAARPGQLAGELYRRLFAAVRHRGNHRRHPHGSRRTPLRSSADERAPTATPPRRRPATIRSSSRSWARSRSQSFAAESLVLIAAEALDRAADSVVDGLPDPALAAEASLRAAQAKVVIDELAPRIATQLFAVGGAWRPSARTTSIATGATSARWPRTTRPSTRPGQSAISPINAEPLPANGFF